jgi:hypothetical protein
MCSLPGTLLTSSGQRRSKEAGQAIPHSGNTTLFALSGLATWSGNSRARKECAVLRKWATWLSAPVAVEMLDDEGYTVWLADFEKDELELVERP